MKKRYTAGTQKHVHGVVIFKEFNSNIYQILSLIGTINSTFNYNYTI